MMLPPSCGFEPVTYGLQSSCSVCLPSVPPRTVTRVRLRGISLISPAAIALATLSRPAGSASAPAAATLDHKNSRRVGPRPRISFSIPKVLFCRRRAGPPKTGLGAARSERGKVYANLCNIQAGVAVSVRAELTVIEAERADHGGTQRRPFAVQPVYGSHGSVDRPAGIGNVPVKAQASVRPMAEPQACSPRLPRV